MPDVPVTQFRISAVDETAAAFNSVRHGFEGLTESARVLQGALGAIGVGLSVGAVVEWAKGTIDAARSLQELSASTGSTVANLSQLANVAKIAGVPMDNLQFAINKLAAGMSGADDESTKVRKALAQLGIDARDPVEAFRALSERFDQYADGAGKAAAMQQIFGRNWAAVVPIMKALREEVGVTATITDAQAKNAEALSRQMNRLGVETHTAADILLSQMVPALTDVATSFNESMRAGMGFWESLKNTGNRGGDFITRIRDLNGQLETSQKALTGAENAGMGEAMTGPLKAKIALLEKQLAVEKQLQAQAAMQGAGALGYTGDVRDYLAQRKPGLPWNTAGADGAAAIDQVQKALDALRLSMEKAAATEANLSEVDKFYIELGKIKIDSMTAERAATINLAYSKAQAADSAKAAATATKQAVKDDEEGFKRMNDLRTKFEEAQTRATKSTADLIESLNTETATMLMTSEGRQRYIALKELDKEKTEGLIKTEEEYVARVNAVNDAFNRRDSMAALKDNLEAQRGYFAHTYSEISDGIASALSDAWERGTSMAKAFTDELKRLFANLVLKPIIQMVMAPFSSMLTGGVNALVGGTANSMFGGGSFGLSNPFGGGFSLSNNTWGGGMGPPDQFGNTSLTYGGYAGQALGGAGIGYGVGTVAGSLFGNARNQQGMQYGGTLGGAAGALTPFGPWGSIIGSLLGSAIGSLIKSGGGPKTGGFYASGPTPGITGVDSSGRWMTPSDQDPAVKQTVEAIGAGYKQLLASVGGHGSASFALGWSADPKGTAPSNVHSGAWVNGVQIADIKNPNVGRTDAEVQAAIAEQSARVIFAALQASSLPEDIKNILNAADAASASVDTIKRLEDFAAAVSTVDTALASLQDVNATLDKLAASSTSAGAFADAGTALDGLLSSYDGTADATTALTTATGAYYQSLVNLLVQVKQVKDAMGKLFSNAQESIYLAGRSNEFIYNFLQKDIATRTGSIAKMTDPNAIGNAGQTIADEITRAFNLLSPEQQAAQRDTYIALLAQVNDIVQARLAAIGASATEKGQTELQQVKTALLDAVTALTTNSKTDADTAQINRQAANTQLLAARTPVQIDLHLDGASPVGA